MTNPEVTLVTGFPAFTAKRLVRRLLEGDAGERIYLLARAKFRADADAFVAELGDAARGRVTVLEGDVCDMDLGLSGAEYRRLTEEVTAIQHLAGIYFQGVKRDMAVKVNIDGTRTVLELAAECKKLRRLTHWSTAQVSGMRAGVILEEELDAGQRFHNVYEETKFRAEKLVADKMRSLPITVLRPGIIVGDSKTGEIDKFDGPYYLMVLIVTSPVDMRLPLPGRGAAPLNVVPIDFAIDAGYALSRDPHAVGRTFHLTDPSPFAARTVYELIARRAEKKPPRGMFPTSIARAVLAAPSLMGIARAPLSFIESFNHMAFYNCRNTLAALEGPGLKCPPFDSYVDNLVRYVRAVHAARREKLEEEAFDPFD